jgi:hypothetical protein
LVLFFKKEHLLLPPLSSTSVGYRLVYEVRDAEVIVVVVAVGRRDRNAVYRAADARPAGALAKPSRDD